MGSIFISYRRDDSEGQAGRLYDDLVAVFGADSVFMDVAAIQPGRNFRTAIDQSLSSCSVFLSLIGRNWLTAADASGRRRLDDPADFVRIETAAVLRRDIPVIPILIQGATAPRPEELPDDLKDLAYRNAMELTHPRWVSDVQLLIKAVRAYVSKPGPEPEVPQRAKKSLRPAYLLGAAGLLMVGLAFYFWPAKGTNGPDVHDVKQASTPPPDSGFVASAAQPITKKPVGGAVRETAELNAAPASPKFEAPNAPAKFVPDFFLAAEQEPMANNPKRYTFTLSVNGSSGVIGDIARVHYNLVYDSNPLSLESSKGPRFSAVYEGWGCYQTVVVTVYFKSSGSGPLEKTFDMCKALER